ncbi:MAG: universal stress protein [Pseudomonadota bacterium]
MAVKKVLFPIDPYNSGSEIESNILNCLENLSKEMEIELLPIHAMDEGFQSTSHYFGPIDLVSFKNHLQEDCEKYMKKFSQFTYHPVEIVENFFGSQSAGVSLICQQIERLGAQLVILSSHGRSGWDRFVLGSFAENMMLQCRIPLLVVGLNYKKTDSFSRALMPVELGEASQKFLVDFLDAHELEFMKELKLYHKITMVDVEDIAWAPSLYSISGTHPNDLLNEAQKTAEKTLQAYMAHPLSQKRLSWEVSKDLGPVSEAITKRTQYPDIDFLIMKSEAGYLISSLFGSATREVIRDSVVPVLVYPHQCELPRIQSA